MRTWSTGSRAAFTLVELLVVVAVMGVVSLVIALSVGRSLPRARLRAEARRLASTVSLARTVAVTERRQVRIEIDLDAGVYGLVIERDPVQEPGVFAPIERPEGRPHKLADGVRFVRAQNEATDVLTSGSLSSTFWRDGSAEKTVIYLGAGEGVFTVVVHGTNGLVKTFGFEQEEIASDDLDLDKDTS